ncbi:4'-phosphopantetheinyl transferase superfamily protein [Ancylothrix sp. C2]|uniref:4'-phosphopantetheinyl transferase family protein n=1 Tax=Ancylothrix sp. D3o TaxID=2953691 RepID=UPI0021BA7650|nr:4'-phosphopantetheinyl transferase superfamily protein [Ancylothrix sp. D3o]MCT7951979.1 4'-phosphopantetheinyl transferase superfamily protein [Ancylothrix sp. D3o]
MTAENITWQPAPLLTPTPAENQIHLWKAFLNQPAAQIQQLSQTLSADEIARANRFHFEKDRNNFIVSRGTLRIILSRYLNLPPQNLKFTYSKQGKPALHTETQICFNLSHSHQLALYAITLNKEIGIDVEFVRPITEAENIVKNYFSDKESALFNTISIAHQTEAFFNAWTRKEAYLKATGQGLIQPLNEIEVSITPGEPAKLLSISGDTQKAGRWTLTHLIPHPSYIACVAISAHNLDYKYWQPN